jgi:hypothetical protein
MDQGGVSTTPSDPGGAPSDTETIPGPRSGPTAVPGSPPATDPGTAAVTIHGVASLGPLSSATVRAFAIADGLKDRALASAVTADTGSYSLHIGFYTGPVLLEASGCTYRDEASGVAIAMEGTVRAALANVTGDTQANITALTAAAVRNAEGASDGLTAAHIDAANAAAKAQPGFDPVATGPIDPTATGVAAGHGPRTLYGVYLGVVSQYRRNDPAKDFADIICDFARGLAVTRSTLSAAILQAAADFGCNPRDQTALTHWIALLGGPGTTERHSAY